MTLNAIPIHAPVYFTNVGQEFQKFDPTRTSSNVGMQLMNLSKFKCML